MTEHSSVVCAAWGRIDTWLAAHAPRTFAELSPPANPAAVERAQREMGLRFPRDLLDSLACHDGTEGWTSLPERPPLSVAGIVEFRRRGMALLERFERQEHPADGDGPDWHALWVPWAESDGDVQVVDLRPGETYGQVGTVHHDEGGLQDTWPSLGAYLTEVADVLEHGGTVGLAAPYLAPDGELRWELPRHVRPEDGLTPAPHARTGRTGDPR
ncbi:SMI1/KNR4 family protein [Streptomyces fumanus]|uniref:SMI1/KNR4 family protein n=1 Tax=Streptomyces fumanus TaxID=67302 RepID=UPI0034092D69